VLAISDINGRHIQLQDLLQYVFDEHAIQSFDRIIFCGNLFGPGANSAEDALRVYEYVIDLQAKLPHVVTTLKGMWDDFLVVLHREQDSTSEYASFALHHLNQAELIELGVSMIELGENRLNRVLTHIEQAKTFTSYASLLFAPAGLPALNGNVIGELSLSNMRKRLWQTNFVEALRLHPTLLKYFDFDVFYGGTPIWKVNGGSPDNIYSNPARLGCQDYGIHFGDRLGAVLLTPNETKTYFAPQRRRSIARTDIDRI
jgi:hypothetical protein